MQEQYRQLRDMISSLALSQEKDTPKWCWDGRGIYTVKSMYSHLCDSIPKNQHANLWKAKLPLKIKIFMWLIENDAILTRDNLARRGWQGDKRCNFCLENESINHLFFDCAMARYVWSLVAYVVGADCRPCSLDQFWVWAKQFLPRGGKFWYEGLAAICWALWRMRNKIHFEQKNCEISYRDHLLSFFLYLLLGRIAAGGRQEEAGCWRRGNQGDSAIFPPARGASGRCWGSSAALMDRLASIFSFLVVVS